MSFPFGQKKVEWGDTDFPRIFLLFFTCLFGGEDVKSAVKDAAISKLKEVRPDGEQLIQEAEPTADKPAE